jgi:hypothetical protein
MFTELYKVRAILQKTGIKKYCKTLTVMTSDIYYADGTSLFLNLQPSKTFIP